ncbi:MAG TPA: histidine kinase dimerization/phospho-acceptor domain-containing protein, partial [Terriglobales bacterium]|nr:histidine kinase dimerization/phospho-acceptor domain-containing protein [Terriglobales bacterium]
MKKRIFFRLLAAFLLVIAVATATLDFAVRRAWETSLRRELQTTLTQKALLFAVEVEHERDRRSLQQIADQVSQAADARATIIDAGGKVLADTRANPQEMENHATRPEFIAALHGKPGSAQRVSHTVGIPFLYVAAPVPGGAVRLAYPLSSIAERVRHVRLQLLFASGLALLAALVLAAILAQGIARRLQRIVNFAEQIAAGDLTARIEETSGDEIAHVAAALDRTARQLERSFAELENGRRQLETLLNSMQDAVLAISAAGKVEWSNGVMQRLAYGHVRVGAPLVETMRDPDFLRAVEEALRTHQVKTARATSLGAGRSFDVIAAPRPGGGAVVVLHDLTEVERVEKTRRDFIANVSHELRTPLTSIQGYAETLLDSGGNGDTREFLEIIRKNAARMSRLTEDLLTLARVESGETEFSLQPHSAAELLHEAQQGFQELKSSGIELEIAESTPAPVQADDDAIQQVLTNLIDNAAKYGAAGGRIVLGAHEVESGVEFYVRDFGA